MPAVALDAVTTTPILQVSAERQAAALARSQQPPRYARYGTDALPLDVAERVLPWPPEAVHFDETGAVQVLALSPARSWLTACVQGATDAQLELFARWPYVVAWRGVDLDHVPWTCLALEAHRDAATVPEVATRIERREARGRAVWSADENVLYLGPLPEDLATLDQL